MERKQFSNSTESDVAYDPQSVFSDIVARNKNLTGQAWGAMYFSGEHVDGQPLRHFALYRSKTHNYIGAVWCIDEGVGWYAARFKEGTLNDVTENGYQMMSLEQALSLIEHSNDLSEKSLRCGA